MSSKTKIVVLHLKELIYTGIFAALGILFIILMIIMFLPDKKTNQPSDIPAEPRTNETQTNEPTPGETQPGNTPKSTGSAQNTSSVSYIPGVYSTAMHLGNHTVDVEVIVDKDNINSIRLVNLDEAVTTMYPLLEPAFDSLTAQIYEAQSLEDITYTNENKYTSLVLLQAIEASLERAVSQPDAETD